ncbi:MAG TPA: DUF6266 family protein [Pedobacter sp.]|uniref:DUF6266 family protein n=1 Tax=Pedobacter sp. TaxID=1411316 RepID=UPI002C00B2AD|nr:DUF6266 family protein [Pedobacter sp.]HMI01776.1 DUF6266 family protein [Pedobacter sp.]
MGILNGGLFGAFEKRTGPLVGRVVRKRNVISVVQHKSLLPRVQLQLEQQMKFRLLSVFLAALKELIAVGFRSATKQSPLNAAFRFNFQSVILGVYPSYTIDFARVLCSRGKLDGPRAAMVIWAPDEAGLIFSWLPDVQNRFNQHTDWVCFAVYCVANGLTATSLYAVRRADLSYSMALPPDFAGQQLHCYVCFASASGHEVSNSVYLNV